MSLGTIKHHQYGKGHIVGVLGCKVIVKFKNALETIEETYDINTYLELRKKEDKQREQTVTLKDR
ncbi:hypothetical protein Amet_0754 [Alkaliphilus metalliredigens QYMF]|uniref:Uncharacterized protein n=1 Tax=Alkaliphilus metalliredigens (strain QYMF) TaxID=293826 RepID=A6TLB1_ALKMQ|nr:hypothetical protein [Alkaliphilus metalliredigens]ABR46979.1 hypothetical protein Amet_0754 [Alkaliphilus metalliredigens QYMF]